MIRTVDYASWSSRRPSPVNPPTDEQAAVQVPRIPCQAWIRPAPPQAKLFSIAEPRSRVAKFEIRPRQQQRTVTTFSKGLQAFQEKQKRHPLMTQSVNPHAPGYRRPDPWRNVSAVRNPEWVKQQRQRGIDRMDRPKPEPVRRSDIVKARQAHGLGWLPWHGVEIVEDVQSHHGLMPAFASVPAYSPAPAPVPVLAPASAFAPVPGVFSAPEVSSAGQSAQFPVTGQG